MHDRWTALLARAGGSHHLLWISLFCVGSVVLSVVGTGAYLVRLPADYFAQERPPLWPDKHPILRALGIFGKNAFAAFLVVMGILMSLPGVPGQGLLTILLGVMLSDFPGKRSLEARILGVRSVHNAINALRRRYGRSPLVVGPPT